MTRKISMVVIMLIAFVALLQCNAFAAEKLPEADANGVITLTENVDLASYVFLKESVTVNLNGFNITNSTEGDNVPVFYVANEDIVLTIEGEGNLSSHGPAVWVVDGKAILKGGSYTSIESSTIYAMQKGKIEIIGGYYKNDAQKTDPTCYVINLKDSDRATASIEVIGGTFENCNPADYTSERPNINYVKDGYKVLNKGNNTFEVVKETATDLFLKAVNKGGSVTLTENIDLTNYIFVKKSVTINLNGFNIINSAKGDNNPVFYVANEDVVLTIEGEGNLSSHGPAVWVVDGKAILKGGSYTSIESSTIYAMQKGKIEIIDGYYKNDAQKTDSTCYVINLKDSDRATASIEVIGGTFENCNPADYTSERPNINYVKDGYTSYETEVKGCYKVCKHNLVKTDAKEATYTADGNIEYYTCDVCKNMFKDAKGTQLTKASDVIIQMLIQVSGGNASVGDVVVDEAIKEVGNSSVVELPAVENATAVTVKAESLDKVVEADKGLTVSTKDTTVTLDAKAVEEVAKQAGDATEITIEVTKTEEKTLNKEQKEAIKDKEVAVVLSATILADGKEISNFNGGKVKVEIPFTPAEGTKGSDYKVYYIADDGKVTAVPTRYVKDCLVVELEHFSEYVVVKEVATAAPAPSAPAGNPNEKDNTPKTGAISVIGLVIAMSVVGLAVLKRD